MVALSSRRRRSAWIWMAPAVALVPLAASFGGPSRPLFLANATLSEPPGLYIGSAGRPTVGSLVAFRAPPAAFPYADLRLQELHRVPLLKGIAAGPGDEVCTTSGRLVINGRDRAPIAQADRQGRGLPHWRGCRRLGADELFAFSDRVPNSFDSRYFGPVTRSAVVGVYRPLVVAQGGR